MTDEQKARIEAFLDALYEHNQNVNLTSVPRPDAWVRHIEDSLLHQDLIPLESRVLDIGCGPGFPAWPLATVRPDLRVTALDANGKMLDFLRTQPLSNLTIVQARAEELTIPETFDVVTGRAVAPLPIQLELSARPLRMGGIFLPMRTPKDASEVERLRECLGLSLTSVTERALTDGSLRLFPIWTKNGRTPRGYPRRWPEIKKSPL